MTIQPRRRSVGIGGPSRSRGAAGRRGCGASRPEPGTSATSSRSSTAAAASGSTPPRGRRRCSPHGGDRRLLPMDDARDGRRREDRRGTRYVSSSRRPRSATPATLRRGCVEALATADVIAAEDTRRLRSLAAALGRDPCRAGGELLRRGGGRAAAAACWRHARRADGAGGDGRGHARGVGSGLPAGGGRAPRGCR